MEDALALIIKHAERRGNETVLILVVMEDALAHGNSVCCHMRGGVLILVVMEDALALGKKVTLNTWIK